MFKVIEPNYPEWLNTAGGSSEKNEDKKEDERLKNHPFIQLAHGNYSLHN